MLDSEAYDIAERQGLLSGLDVDDDDPDAVEEILDLTDNIVYDSEGPTEYTWDNEEETFATFNREAFDDMEFSAAEEDAYRRYERSSEAAEIFERLAGLDELMELIKESRRQLNEQAAYVRETRQALHERLEEMGYDWEAA
jgi:hypothetical protein